MRSILILLVIVFVLSSTCARNMTLNQHWKIWKNQFNKSYSNVEERLCRVIWENNLKIVEEHHRQANLGAYTYWLGMNQFGDLTNEEFVKLLNDFRNWRDKDVVVPVKDQGQCGSLWAFAAVGSIESAYAIKTGKLVSLSEQQLIDYSTLLGNMGCYGGSTTVAFQYIQEAGGIQASDTYPYKAIEDKCTFTTSKVIVELCGFVNISFGSEAALQQAVALLGPVAASVDARHQLFQFYRSGVYNEPYCSQTKLDFSMLIVGYGNESDKDYWLLKNSWGVGWGAQGYIKMTRNKNNQCGIATLASYPILC
ncbi:unnamed protein product [Adineta steineri]|uniref:Uncharacterized protein n=1 Tax=Adineta steineri TaxID=433720 RepID=A0A819Y542_9BILA|nr:unnamed protein product [Adineta steineri]CAF1059784.1 unnamed protein product [Adineta steineri]CAF3949541.1 unnamed protein product [Adineta steineri]CAF4147139.1 unnamed protein product [Adineta steineri]